jgi:peptidoglycan/xylan/chitin deacetylase (PgdA/CDA1 family)
VNTLVPVFRCLSPPGHRARLSILIYHRVLPEPDPLFPDLPDAARFREVLRWMKSWFNVLPLDEAVRRLAAGTLPGRAAAITFDDGYADNFTVALPLLREHGLTATFFIASGFLDGGRMWNDTIIEVIRRCPLTMLDLEHLDLGRHILDTLAARRNAIDTLIDRVKYRPGAQRIALTENIVESLGVAPPTDLMMTSHTVQQLRRAGMQIGAHTLSHPVLSKLTLEEARREIADDKAKLENLLSERVGLFAYPNGKLGEDYIEEHVSLVRAIGFDAAFSTAWGAATCGSDLMQLPRFTPWDRSRLGFGVRLAANLVRGTTR